jgi:molybdopterin synthase catalytic subunit
MSVRVTIIDGPLAARAPETAGPRAGAILVFEGVAREHEGEALIDSLDYEAYEPMATRMLESIGHEVVSRHGLISLWCEHSRGRVPVGERSFRLTIAAPHRKEALAAADEFIDRLKRDVPIWKRAVAAAGTDPARSNPSPTGAGAR